jgi:uncharacterized protein YjbI with pentapeptide repeats
MKYQNFRNKDIQGTDFSGQDLTGSNFRDANITGCDFTDAVLHFCNFKGATQDNAIFTNAKISFSVGIENTNDADTATQPVEETEEPEDN